MKTLSNTQLAKEVRKLRTTLDPIINLQFKELLIEVERRLNGGGPGELGPIKSKKQQQRKRLTKKEAFLYYFYK